VSRIDLKRTPRANVFSLSGPDLAALGKALGVPPSAGAESSSDEASRTAMAAAVRDRLRGLDMDVFTVYSITDLYNCLNASPLWKQLPKEKQGRLRLLAEKTHMSLREEKVRDPATAREKTRVSFYFDGLPDRAGEQNGTTLKGGIGKVYRMAREAGQLVAEALKTAPDVEVAQVCGVSMGGGSAQMFATALQNHVQLPKEPTLILLDPMLLNKKQARHAVERAPEDSAPQANDFKRPHGLMITLDASHAPRKNLVDRLQGVGYKAEGLVRLHLGLERTDGLDLTQPKPEWLMGYHGNRHLYGKALHRFTAGE